MAPSAWCPEVSSGPNPDQLFVSNAHNTAADSGTVSAFTVNGGSLTAIGTFSLPADAAPAGIVVS